MCLYANTRPVKFFKFGPTPDNPVDHLYEFSFNGETGAEFRDNEVILHFIDGKRGDSDLTKNGIIVDPGTPAIKASNAGASPKDIRSDKLSYCSPKSLCVLVMRATRPSSPSNKPATIMAMAAASNFPLIPDITE